MRGRRGREEKKTDQSVVKRHFLCGNQGRAGRVAREYVTEGRTRCRRVDDSRKSFWWFK